MLLPTLTNFDLEKESNVRFCLAETDHFVTRVELTPFLEQFDPFEPLQYVPFGFNPGCALQAAML